MNSIFIFRRDLRITDNTALINCIRDSSKVTTIFILDPRQVKEHQYRSNSGLYFMFNSLKELNDELIKKGGKLYLFYGESESIIGKLLETKKYQSVYFNRDYSPFSRMRDEKIFNVCKHFNVELKTFHDALLTPPKQGLKADLKPYTIFTPFFKKNSQKIIPKPLTISFENKLENISLESEKHINFLDELLTGVSLPSKILLHGGRKEGVSLLNNLKNLSNYNNERDIPSIKGTSNLSAHHKFGTVSIRESYWTAKDHLPADSRFISELYWRDFMTQIGFFFPHVYGSAFQEKFKDIKWDNNKDLFDAWCNGQTGYPIVDAGMRELNETGNMHNRVRMITASFLVKDLHIDWQWGERYFAQKLLDYDPAVNNGSWQWAASTGCDAQPYFRIFNPWLQQTRFDPSSVYIKKWIPELNDFSSKVINLGEKNGFVKGYIKPVVDHNIAKIQAVEMYKI